MVNQYLIIFIHMFLPFDCHRWDVFNIFSLNSELFGSLTVMQNAEVVMRGSGNTQQKPWGSWARRPPTLSINGIFFLEHPLAGNGFKGTCVLSKLRWRLE